MLFRAILRVQGQPDLPETLPQRGMGEVAHAFSPSAQEADVGGSLQVWPAWSM